MKNLLEIMMGTPGFSRFDFVLEIAHEKVSVLNAESVARVVDGVLVPYKEGERVQVVYAGETYTGAVIGYYKTPSGDNALGVQLDVNVGQQVKYFLNKKKPVITRL